MYSIKQNRANVSKYLEINPPKTNVYLHFIYKILRYVTENTSFHYKDQSLGTCAQLRKVLLPSSCPSVCPHLTSATPTAQIYVKNFTGTSVKIARKNQIWLKYGKISGTLHDALTTFIMLSEPLNCHKGKNLSEMFSGCQDGHRGTRESATILRLILDFRLPPRYN